MHKQSNASSLQSGDSGFSGSDGDNSNRSYHSYDTAPTEYSSSTRPPFAHHETCGGRLENHHNAAFTKYETHYQSTDNPRASVETYASTIDFEDDGVAEDESDYRIPEARNVEIYPSEALPATPADFGELFPSTREIQIKHDDSTNDGNMNLRLDTMVPLSRGKSQAITLFHLRMHDLKKREFSLRRYCRDSGREVCHSVRKYQESAAERRPSFGRSISNAIAALKSMSDGKTANASHLKRSDSGYGSIMSRKSIEIEEDSIPASNTTSRRHPPIPTNTTKVEFSNYSQVEIKRRGTKSSKRYEFEYWGTEYTWRRIVERNGISTRAKYHLYRAGDSRILARIEPWDLTETQADEEHRKGGWIPPCTMQIYDKHILEDRNEASDVIVASGLIALVDDCIKQFHPRPHRQLVIPVPKLRVDVNYVGTRALFKELLHRSNERGTPSNRRPTTLRNISYDV